MISTSPSPSPMLRLPESLRQRLAAENRKLKIEILECEGGAGHKMSAEAIKQAVEGHFGLGNVVVDKYDVGSHLAPDPLSFVTFGQYSVIHMHNSLARHGRTKLISLMSKVGRVASKIQSPFTCRHFRTRYEKNKPDLVISAIPLINGIVLQSLKEQNIPLMVVSTDADNRLFSTDWPQTEGLSPYRYCIPYNSLEVVNKVSKKIDMFKVRGVGYPLRESYTRKYTQAERQLFKERHFLEEEDGIVGVMMGGLGGQALKKYFSKVAKGVAHGELKKPRTRFVFFCGNNKAMRKSLKEKLKKLGWECDLSGDRGKLFKYCEIQLGILKKLRKQSKDHSKLLHLLEENNRAMLADGLENMMKGTTDKLQSIKTENFIVEAEKIYSHLVDDLNVFRHSSGASATVLGFTNQDHEYAVVSDAWVTKTGSSSFNQCIYQHVPMLLDNTSRPLDWEALNFDIGKTYHFSETVTSMDQFFPQLNAMLESEKNREYRQAEEKYLMQRPRQQQFSRNIVDLTYELIEEAEEKKEKREEKVGLSAAAIALRVVKFVWKILIAPLTWIRKTITNYSYFSGFNCTAFTQELRRRQLIRQRNAEPLEGDLKPLSSPVSNQVIDALRIPSTSKNPTGNAVIFVLGKHYQQFHPQNYDHLLSDGADVILFNPSQPNTKTMAADLKEVIKELQRLRPEQKLALHGYCVGGHVAASVAAEIAAGNVEGIEAESIPAIIDRGFDDAYKLATSKTLLARLPFAKSYINQNYNGPIDGIEKHNAPMLFVTPLQGNDQINHKRHRNFTLDIMARHTQGTNQIVQLTAGDHWSAWTIDAHNKVKKFLSKQGIIDTSYQEVNEEDFGGRKKLTKNTSVPWVRRNIVPVFL